MQTLEKGLKKKNVGKWNSVAKEVKMTLEKKTAIEEAMKKEGIAGLYFTDHPSRMYPNGIFSSHFIGYALAENEENDSSGLVGKTGLEAAYDDVLSGTDGKIVYQKDNNQNPLPGTVAESVAAVDGKRYLYND